MDFNALWSALQNEPISQFWMAGFLQCWAIKHSVFKLSFSWLWNLIWLIETFWYLVKSFIYSTKLNWRIISFLWGISTFLAFNSQFLELFIFPNFELHPLVQYWNFLQGYLKPYFLMVKNLSLMDDLHKYCNKSVENTLWQLTM